MQKSVHPLTAVLLLAITSGPPHVNGRASDRHPMWTSLPYQSTPRARLQPCRTRFVARSATIFFRRRSALLRFTSRARLQPCRTRFVARSASTRTSVRPTFAVAPSTSKSIPHRFAYDGPPALLAMQTPPCKNGTPLLIIRFFHLNRTAVRKCIRKLGMSLNDNVAKDSLLAQDCGAHAHQLQNRQKRRQ